VWTVNNFKTAAKLLDYGVDMIWFFFFDARFPGSLLIFFNPDMFLFHKGDVF